MGLSRRIRNFLRERKNALTAGDKLALRDLIGATTGSGEPAPGGSSITLLEITQAAYDALETKSPTTLYLITED